MPVENSTFTSRATANQGGEAVEADDSKAVDADATENKAVARKSTRTKKK